MGRGITSDHTVELRPLLEDLVEGAAPPAGSSAGLRLLAGGIAVVLQGAPPGRQPGRRRPLAIVPPPRGVTRRRLRVRRGEAEGTRVVGGGDQGGRDTPS